jgi:hypothetical protein
MAPDGTDVVPLTTDAGPDVVIDQPVASPDGRYSRGSRSVPGSRAS